MSSLERGLIYLEDFMKDQAFCHKVVASHKALALQLLNRIEEVQIGKVSAIFGSGEFYRLLNFKDDGGFESVTSSEILRHKRSLLEIELDEYNQLKNLPDLDLLIIVDKINFDGQTRKFQSIDNFRLLYSDHKNLTLNFPDLLPFDVGMITQDSFENILKEMYSPKKKVLDTTDYLLIRAKDSFSQSRYVKAWVRGFILNASIPIIWNNVYLKGEYEKALHSFSTKISAEDWCKFLVLYSNVWRSYYPEIYKEDSLKNVISSRWRMFLQCKGLELS